MIVKQQGLPVCPMPPVTPTETVLPVTPLVSVKSVAGKTGDVTLEKLTAFSKEYDGSTAQTVTIDDVKLTSNFTASTAQGNIKVGDVITSGTPLLNVVKRMLTNSETPVEPTTVYWGCTDTIPISSTQMTPEVISASVLEGRKITHTFSTANAQYESFAYKAAFGNLTAIFENDIAINLLSSFTKTTIMVDSIEYNLYYSTEPAKEQLAKYDFILEAL